MNNNDGKIIFETRGGETKVIEKRPVGRPPKPVEYTSPYPTAFSLNGQKESPVDLGTELTTRNQIRFDEGTLKWGKDDALPLHILSAIAESPTATSCIGKIEQFTKGSGFSDQGLMDLVINEEGQTLWQLHCELVPFFSALDAFSANLKFDSEGRITSAYCIDTSGIRFKAEPETNQITGIKYNPYFGSSEYKKSFTTDYHLFNTKALPDQIKSEGTKFEGQVYWYGVKRALYKHYPVPKFWSGKKWIYSDAKLATYIDTLLDNGFFSSVLMNVIGDPNKPSQHDSAMREVTGVDGVKRKESFKTEGEVFSEMMAQNFSGVQKAAKAMVTWSLNKDQSVNIQPFQTNTDFNFVSGTLRETIRMITIATEVPGILANLPDEVSPLSGQDTLKRAVEFMQSNTNSRRVALESFYNNILLPNLQKPVKQKVQIQQYQPASISVTVDDKFWEFMNEAEKIKFIEQNEPNIELVRTPIAESNTIPATVDENGEHIPAPTAPTINQSLKSLQTSEINRILSISKKVSSGVLTAEQGRMLLAGYGLSDEQIDAFLNPQPVEL